METEVEWVADHGQIMKRVMLMPRNHANRGMLGAGATIATGL
jgi:hypothetical protein